MIGYSESQLPFLDLEDILPISHENQGIWENVTQTDAKKITFGKAVDGFLQNKEGQLVDCILMLNPIQYADQNGFILEIREKLVISDHATVGIYYFSKGRDFVGSAIDMIVRGDRVNNEFYVAPAYNYAISCGKRFSIHDIRKEQMHGTGTPDDLNAYLAYLSGKGKR